VETPLPLLAGEFFYGELSLRGGRYKVNVMLSLSKRGIYFIA
jgi:hypothetical protein